MSDRSHEELEGELRQLRARLAELEREPPSGTLQSAVLDTLRDLAPGLAGRRRLGEILRKVLGRVGALLGTEHAFVALTDERDASLSLRYGTGTFESHSVQSLQRGEGLAGRVWALRKPVVVDDYTLWDGRSARIAESAYRAVAGVPLNVAGNTIGVLGAAIVEGDKNFTPRDVEMLEGVAEVAAVAIDNARLLEDETRARNEAERLLAAAESISGSLDLDKVLGTILKELRNVVPYDSASVQQLNGDSLTIIGGVGPADDDAFIGLSFSIQDDSIPNGIVMRERVPLIVGDATRFAGFRLAGHGAEQIRSWLGVPLRSGDDLVGMIALDKWETDFYDQRHARLALAFCQQAALAIENARLFSAVNRELAERKRIEERLAQAEISYKTLVEQLPAIVYEWSIGQDATGESETAYISPQVMTFLGYTQQEWLSDPDLWWKVLHPEDRERVRAYLDKKDETGIDVNILHRLVSKDGRVLWFQNQSRTLRDEHGRPKQTHGLMLDVTELKRTEEELRELFEEVIAARSKAEDRTEQLEGLNRIAITLGSIRDLQASLEVVARDAALLFRASSAAIAFLDDEREEFHVMAEHRVARVPSLLGERFTIKRNPLLQKLSKSTRPFVFTESMNELLTTPTRAYLESRNVHSIIFVPLIVRSEIIAELMIECDSVRRFTPTQLQLAETIGGHVGSAIATARLLDEMQRASDAANAASLAKSEFLANMSHEIRTPMNAVIGMTGLLLDSQLTPSQREFAETIRQSGEVMLTLINDILDFSKIEAGRLELESQAFDIYDCVESVLDLFAMRSSQKGIELAYLIDQDVPPVVRGDATRLRQILVNLVGNAVKFTERGSVLVGVFAQHREGNEVELVFEVRDTGVGIPEERMNRLFQSFSQGDASTTRRYGGTGLGLAISSRLAELMGGRIWVDSLVGSGSSFHVSIRCEAVVANRRQFLRPDQPIMAGRSLLVVSRNEVTTEIVDSWAETWGLSVISTSDVAVAEESLRSGQRVDLMIIDTDHANGAVQVVEQLRAAAGSSTLPSIIISPMGSRPVDDKDPTVGYMSRPIKPSALYNLVVAFILGEAVPTEQHRYKSAYDHDLGNRLPLRILIAEDNSVNQRLAALTLEHLGYRADIVANGIEALEALRRQRYDVVLMDVQMPELDGLETTRRIAETWPIDQRPLVIAMTANAMPEDRQACFDAGMDDYLSKPLKVEDLAAALESAAESLGEDRPAAGGLDRDKVAELRSLRRDGRPAILEKLLETYLRDTPELIEQLSLRVDEGDSDAMSGTAHSLKGSSLTIGALRLGNLAASLEAMGRSGTCDGAAPIVAQIAAEFGRVRDDASRLAGSDDLHALNAPEQPTAPPDLPS